MTSKIFFEHHSSLFVTLSSAAFVVDVDVGDDSTLTLKKAFLVQLLVTVSFFFERKNGAAQKIAQVTDGGSLAAASSSSASASASSSAPLSLVDLSVGTRVSLAQAAAAAAPASSD